MSEVPHVDESAERLLMPSEVAEFRVDPKTVTRWAVSGRIGSIRMVVVAADLVWVLYSTVAGFPGRVEAIFQTLVGALTLALVFVIQHTQAREQLVTQRKLDEILRALPHADNALIAFEEASDDELASTHHSHRRLRAQALDPPAIPTPPEAAGDVTRPVPPPARKVACPATDPGVQRCELTGTCQLAADSGAAPRHLRQQEARRRDGERSGAGNRLVVGARG
jgi:low affinity Fe/Cu permease